MSNKERIRRAEKSSLKNVSSEEEEMKESNSHLEKKEDFLEAFKRANKVIRREIGQRVHLKYVPTINFVFDNSITEVRKLDKIFASKKVKKDIER